MKTYTNEQKIDYALRKMGVPQNLKGYRCLKVAIESAMNDASVLENTMELYKYIAVMLVDTPSKVERAIRNAIEQSWLRISKKLVDDVFGNTLLPEHKPTNSHYIAAISEILTDYDEHPILL